jgi:hypothetical protein
MQSASAVAVRVEAQQVQAVAEAQEHSLLAGLMLPTLAQ